MAVLINLTLKGYGHIKTYFKPKRSGKPNEIDSPSKKIVFLFVVSLFFQTNLSLSSEKMSVFDALYILGLKGSFFEMPAEEEILKHVREIKEQGLLNPGEDEAIRVLESYVKNSSILDSSRIGVPFIVEDGGFDAEDTPGHKHFMKNTLSLNPDFAMNTLPEMLGEFLTIHKEDFNEGEVELAELAVVLSKSETDFAKLVREFNPVELAALGGAFFMVKDLNHPKFISDRISVNNTEMIYTIAYFILTKSDEETVREHTVPKLHHLLALQNIKRHETNIVFFVLDPITEWLSSETRCVNSFYNR